MKAFSLVVGAGLLTMSVAPVGAGSVWTRMSYADVWSDPSLSAIWHTQAAAVQKAFVDAAGVDSLKRMGGHAPFVSVSTRFTRPGVEVVASIALGAGLCDNGPNSATSNQIHSVCPLKVSVTRGTVVKTLLVPDACYLEVEHDATPGGPRPADNGDFAYLDASSRKLTVETIRDGVPIESCTKTVDVGIL